MFYVSTICVCFKFLLYQRGCTALHVAAAAGHATTAKILVDARANIDAVDKV